MPYFTDNLRIHLPHYLLLFLVLATGFGAVVLFSPQKPLQLVSAALTCGFYVIWGAVHHYLEKDAHPRVIFQYAAVALLGFLVLYSLISRA